MKDLVILTADNNAKFALEGALTRPESLEIRPVQCEFRVHPGRDGGVRTSGPDMLARERERFTHALLVLDFEGCGTDLASAEALEAELDVILQPQWEDKAKAIVIQPEVDVWIWGSDNAVGTAIKWPPGQTLREWLGENGFALDANGKPTRPKEAMEAVLRLSKQPRSSALYNNIAKTISLQRCKDKAFGRLCKQLKEWFPR